MKTAEFIKDVPINQDELSGEVSCLAVLFFLVQEIDQIHGIVIAYPIALTIVQACRSSHCLIHFLLRCHEPPVHFGRTRNQRPDPVEQDLTHVSTLPVRQDQS